MHAMQDWHPRAFAFVLLRQAVMRYFARYANTEIGRTVSDAHSLRGSACADAMATHLFEKVLGPDKKALQERRAQRERARRGGGGGGATWAVAEVAAAAVAGAVVLMARRFGQ